MTLFLKQNKHHKYSVLFHTIKVVYHVLQHKEYKMIAGAIFHDIGKPVVAYQDEKDKITGEYSFTNHEEVSYQIIKHTFLSDYTKNLVRYHYLLRGMKLAKKREQMGKYHRMKRSYDSLDKEFVKDLAKFLKYDDMAKK